MNLFHKLKNYRTMPEPVKASLWYTVCNVLQKGMALLATPIFTRLLTKEQYGEHAVFLSWYNILMIFATFNVFQSAYDKGLLLHKQDERRFTSSMLGLCTAITTVLLAVYLAAVPFWTELLGLSPVLMGAMFLLLYASPALSFWAARERFAYRYKKYVAITLATTALSLLTGVGAVLATEYKVEARVFSDVVSKSVFYLVLYGLIMAQGRTFFRKDYWKYGLLFNLPLIPHYLSTYVLNQADRVMIDKLVGSAEAGVYSVAYTISTMIMLIITAINNSLVPYVYKSIHAGEHGKVKGGTRSLFLLVAGLCILSMCFAPEVILIFAGAEYSDAIGVIPPIAASIYFIFVYSMFSTVEYYYQKTGLIALASCASAVLNLVLNDIFIRLFGYYAAGYTTLACYILLAALHYGFYRRVLRQELNTGAIHDLKAIALCGVLVLGVMGAMVLTYRWWPVRYLLVAALLTAAIIKRKALLFSLKPQ